MSKLESAFSKALREQSLAKENSPHNGVAGQSESRSRKLEDLVSSRDQISRMEHHLALTDEELAGKRLIHPGMKDKELLNTYRNLRTRLLASCSEKNFTTLVTSVVPDEGSSLVSANLAATFAFDEGKTSLLVEANVHAPLLANLFGLGHNASGLMECLESSEISVSDILHETGIPRLRFIPSGQSRESSVEYFTSEKMHRVIQEIKIRYPERFPIINAPSVNGSADAKILLDLCDRVLLVIPYGLCTEENVKNAVQIIGKEKLAGVVLDRF